MSSRKDFCPQCDSVFTRMNKLQVVCSAACAIRHNSEEEIEKRFQLMKEDSKPLSEVLKNTKVVFQKWIKLRDAKQKCISCDRTEGKKYDAGHFYDAENYQGLTFNPDNVHKQCVKCNLHLKGNVLAYRKGLINRIGVERLRELDRLSHDAQGAVFTKKLLVEIALKYKQEIKLLKSNK